jgi:hypothetical protein
MLPERQPGPIGSIDRAQFDPHPNAEVKGLS